MSEYSLEQEEAIALCVDLSNPIVSVTGAAGTGKTTVLKEVYDKLTARGVKVALVAPTGRAAKRIHELTRRPAQTIHKLLEFPRPDENDPNPPRLSPRRSSSHPIEQAVVIVDEASMLSTDLNRQLVEAIPRPGRIRYFGDNNQLPPVEKSRHPPFVKALTTQPSAELTFNFRSGDEIISNANRILQGKPPQRNPRFEIVTVKEPTEALFEMVDDSFRTGAVQILTPQRKGRFGTQRLNPSLQLKLNPRGAHLTLDRLSDDDDPITVRVGDKAIWIRNDYTFNLFNGETGSIIDINEHDGSLVFETQDRTVTIPHQAQYYHAGIGQVVHYDPRKQIELAYAITTHKAQGSEFDTIVYVVTSHAPYLLDRRNFYTAITRAKSNVILITDVRALGYSLRRRTTV